MTSAAPSVLRARGVLTPGGLLRDGVVVVRQGHIDEVRSAVPGDPPALDGWIVPGLVNAHLHLELSAVGRVPGGDGFMAWGGRLMAQDRSPDPDAEARAARAMHDAGTAGVFDISNRGDTAATLEAARLRGVVQHEFLGWSNRPGLDGRVDAARAPATGNAVRTRPGPHAVYSTPPALLQASAAPRDGVPASIHLGEDPGEVELVTSAAGPFIAWLRGIGVPEAELLEAFGHGHGLLEHLDHLGVLSPGLFLVHGVQLTPPELSRLGALGVPVCLCPRSNLHILGALPDVPAMVQAGVPLCLGTDSLASSPDLDVLGEVEVLVDAFPSIEPITWLQAATAGGARAIGRRDLGRIAVGARPGLLLIEGVSARTSWSSRPSVRWLDAPLPSPEAP